MKRLAGSCEGPDVFFDQTTRTDRYRIVFTGVDAYRVSQMQWDPTVWARRVILTAEGDTEHAAEMLLDDLLDEGGYHWVDAPMARADG